MANISIARGIVILGPRGAILEVFVIEFNLRNKMASRLYSGVFATPRGRAFQLNVMAMAEEADEGGFDEILAAVEIPEIKKMVAAHQQDEKRHAQLLRKRVQQIGVDIAAPPRLSYVERIRELMVDDQKRFEKLSPSEMVMEMYLHLELIEQRGVEQFELVADAFRPVDPETAFLIDRITVDERRHVKISQTISHRYASDPAILNKRRKEFARVERQAFNEFGLRYLGHVLKHELLTCSGPERFVWKMLAASEAPRAGVEEPA